MSILKKMITGFLIVTLAIGISPAMADDWTITRLRGLVFALENGEWEPLARGDVVADNREIRTLGGRVVFERDGESIDLGPNTQIRISDRTGQRYTIVQQYFGTVTIEANVEDVQHFAVQTSVLAAVVKGTRFSVTATIDSAEVMVLRGRVQVRDPARQLMVDITPGQTADVSRSQQLQAHGRGVDEVVSVDGTKPDNVDDSTSDDGDNDDGDDGDNDDGDNDDGDDGDNDDGDNDDGDNDDGDTDDGDNDDGDTDESTDDEKSNNGNHNGHDKDDDEKSNNGNHNGNDKDDDEKSNNGNNK